MTLACSCRICKAARRRPTRAGRALLRIHTKHLLKSFRAVKAWFRLIDAAVRYGVEQQMLLGREPMTWMRPSAVGKMGKAGPRYTGVSIVDHLVDWDCVGQKGTRFIGPHQVKVYGEAFGQAALLAKLKTPWNLRNRKAIEWSRRYVTPHMRDLVGETRLGIRRLITDGLERGLSTAQTAREMRRLESFSMNPGQARALGNYRTKLGAVQDRIGAALAESGGNAAEAGRLLRGKVPKAWVNQVRDGRFDVDGRVAKEAGRKARYRAEMIARTETSRAVSEGTLEGYAEAGVQMVRWEAAADACEICAGWDGTVMTLAEGEGMIPEHCNCRCTWVPEEPEAAVAPAEAAAEEAEEEMLPEEALPAAQPVAPPTGVAPAAAAPEVGAEVLAAEKELLDVSRLRVRPERPLVPEKFRPKASSQAATDEFWAAHGGNPHAVSQGHSEIAMALDQTEINRVVLREAGGQIRGAVSFATKPMELTAKPWADWVSVEHLGSTGEVKGTGTELMRHAIDRAARLKQGIVFEATPGSVGFYERLGFVHLDPAMSKIMGATPGRVKRIRTAMGPPRGISKVP